MAAPDVRLRGIVECKLPPMPVFQPSAARRGFHWHTKADHHHPDAAPSISFGLYTLSGQPAAEIFVEWPEGSGESYPRLTIYGDSLHLLATMHDVLQKIAEISWNSGTLTEEQLVKTLRRLEFADLTNYRYRYPKRQKPRGAGVLSGELALPVEAEI